MNSAGLCITRHIYLLLTVALLPTLTEAADIHIDNSNTDGSIVITWADFEQGFSVNAAAAQVRGSVVFVPDAATPRLTFSGNWISNGGAGGSAEVYFVDTGTTHVRTLLTTSSYLEGSLAHISGTFASSIPADLGTAPAGSTQLAATGTSQDVTQYVSIPQNLTVSVTAPLVAVAPASGFGGTGTPSNPSGGTIAQVNQTITQAVDTANGNTYIRFSDLVVPGKGLHFAFARSYNGLDPYVGPLCRGWTHSYNVLLTFGVAGNVKIKEADGHEDIYAPGASAGSYVSPKGVYNTLVQTASGWILTRPDQTEFAFAPIPLNAALIRLLSINDENGNTQSLAYDINGNLITFTDVGGGVFNFAYDGLNHLTSLSQTINGLSRSLSFFCDSALNLTKFVDAAGKVSLYSYSVNRLATVTDPRANPAVVNSFDGQGRVVRTTRGAGATAYVTNYVYDEPNHKTTVTDYCGNVITHYYDSASPPKLLRIVNSLGAQTVFTYDGNNNLATLTNPLQQTTTYTYDERGNRTSLTDPLSHVSRWTWDADNNQTSATDPNGNITRFTYDSRGNLLKVTDAVGGVATLTYDSRGNKISSTNPNRKTTLYTYDVNNRVVSTTDPLGGVTRSAYDGFGRLASQTQPAGNVKVFSYDVLGHITKTSFSPPVILLRAEISAAALARVSDTTYTYDANGNRLSMVDSTGQTSYGYDALNHVTSISFPNGQQVQYGYGCNDNRTSLSYPGKNLTYTFDEANRMAKVVDGSQTASYAYDLADNLLSLGYSTGAAVGYSYDAAGRIVQVTNSFRGGGTATATRLSSFSYVLDNVGNRLQVTDGGGIVTALSYDRLNRLTSSTVDQKSSTYSYDPNGNRIAFSASATRLSYLYDDGDRLVTLNGSPFTYDANGNLLSRGSGSAQTTYQFDAANRLVSIAGSGVTPSAFTYDGDGNRVKQVVGGGTYNYLNDIATSFSTVLAESGPDASIAYVRGRGLISATGPAFNFFYHYDAQSTVMGISDASGKLVQRYVYDVWGLRTQVVPSPQVTTQNKFGYTGEALDPGSLLYYLRARYYDPTLGRFLNSDPLPGFDKAPQTLNRFVYTRNNPATLTDRTGLCSDEDAFELCDSLWPGAPALP